MAPRIYTRTGDQGTTGIHGGARVPKDDPRIEAGGTLDELNCQLGIIRSLLPFRMSESFPQAQTEPFFPACTRKEGTTFVPPGQRTTRTSESERSDGRVLDREHFSASETKPGGTERAMYDEILHTIQKTLMTVMSLVATPSADRDKNPNQLPENLVADCEKTIDALTEEAGPGLHFLLPGGTPLAAHLQMARAICRSAERRLWTLHRIDPVPEEILQYINRLSDLFFVMARHELASQNWPEERWHAFAYKNQPNPTGKVEKDA
jgi:ATP:cob(I)alamin adenosyltransferase